MKTIKTFLIAAFAATLFLLGCTSGADAPADANAVDSTAVAETPAPAAAIPDSMDVRKVATNVYKSLADSLGLRVYEIVFEPGESVPMHSHPDHAIYVVDGGTLEVPLTDGTKRILELKPGMGLVSGAETHSATNTGKTAIKAVVVEVHRPR